MVNYQFHWLENASAEYTEVRPTPRSHADPTADAAIGAVMREEKRKTRAEKNARAERNARAEAKKKTVTRVWRADKEGKKNA